jgi:preprotein translocase SecE subunit
MKITEYFKSVVEETKAIVFPPRKRVVVDSSIVIASLILGGALIGIVDFGFSKLVQQFILLIQQ